MVREDLVAGLRNAVERGNSLESAKQSFLNAGYSSEDVEQAVNYLHSGSVLAAQPQQLKKPADSVQPSKEKKVFSSPASPQKPISNETVKGTGFFARNWKIILLLGVLFVLIVLFVLVLIFRDSISSWF